MLITIYSVIRLLVSRKTHNGNIWLSENHQGNGIITRAVSKLIDVVFSDLGIEKIQISTGADNLPSRKVCERLDMKLEGIISNSEDLNGRIIDHAIYGLSKRG